MNIFYSRHAKQYVTPEDALESLNENSPMRYIVEQYLPKNQWTGSFYVYTTEMGTEVLDKINQLEAEGSIKRQSALPRLGHYRYKLTKWFIHNNFGYLNEEYY